MAKKDFVSRDTASPFTQTPSVSREEVASTNGYNPILEQLTFLVLDGTS